MNNEILIGDCRDKMKEIPSGTVHCCVTSPPYWGLRSYMPDKVKMRQDLTSIEVEHVLAELKKLGIEPE